MNRDTAYPRLMLAQEALSLRTQAKKIKDPAFREATLARAAGCDWLAKLGDLHASFPDPTLPLEQEGESILDNRH